MDTTHTPREIDIVFPETALAWPEYKCHCDFENMTFIQTLLAPSEIRSDGQTGERKESERKEYQQESVRTKNRKEYQQKEYQQSELENKKEYQQKECQQREYQQSELENRKEYQQERIPTERVPTV